MTGVQLTMVVMMVCLTCLHITGVSGQQSTEAETYKSTSEVDQMIKAARQEMADIMIAARQELTDDVMRAARQETEELRAALRDVTGKLEGQNTIIKKLGLENVEMKKDIEGQQAEIEGQRVENEGQNIQIQELKVQIKEQKIQIEGHKVQIEGQKVHIEKFVREQVVMAQQIEGLITADKRHDDESQQIAFSVVSHQNFGPVTLDTNVEYEEVHTNIGGGWLPLANAFQAPVDGVYMFTASMVSHISSTDHIYCHIVHNTPAGQTTVATLFGRLDHNGADANSVIIELAEDDIVSVQLVAGDRILAGSATFVYSTFSGFLIFT